MFNSNTPKNAQARILFVDDSRLIRFAGDRFLRESFDVDFAQDGRQAWRMLQQDDAIRVVITDLMMPELDGLELIRMIRSARDERIRALPILVVTSVEEKAGRRDALEAGANDLVPKPFSGADLIEPVNQYLERTTETYTPASSPAVLPNIEDTRGGLVRRLEQINCFHDRHGLEYSILHARLDNYDEITRRFGLNWAESMMRHFARALARVVRTEDTIGRSDDAVFSVILMTTPAPGARRLRARLRDHLQRNPVRFPGRTMDFRVSFSIQCPGDTRDGHSADAILQAGLTRLADPANVTRLSDRITA